MTRSWLPLLALCATLAACAAGDDSRPAPTAAQRQPAGAAPAHGKGHGPLRVGPTSRFDVARQVAVPVRVRVPRGSFRARGSLTVGGRRPIALSAPQRVRGGGARSVTLPVRGTAARALAGNCADARLDVSVRGPAGRAVARRSKPLPATAPDCARYFGPRAVWNRPIGVNAPIDEDSAALVADLGRQVQAGYDNSYPPTINATSYSTPVYTVPRGQKRFPVQLTRGQDYGQSLQKVLDRGVPIPDGARPAAGGDAHIVVWQPSTDTMWELWTAKRVDGRWQAGWGGRMKRMSRTRGYFTDPWGILPGATASSLPLLGGLITLRDLRRGRIDHALAMAIPDTRSGVWSLPAQRTDGNDKRPDSIPQGARFRLDPDVDVDALGLPPFTAMLARAAQRYGIFVRDTSPVVTLYAEDPTPTGQNPWAQALEPSAAELLRRFPWQDLELMPMDLRTYGGKRVAR